MIKKFLSPFVALILVFSLSLSMFASAKLSDFTPTDDDSYLKFISFNLRYDVSSHPAMSENVRGPHLLELIQKYGADSIGFQEATDTWMSYLRTEMNKLGYSYVGVGRDTGTDEPSRTGNGNEFSPIFYNSQKFDCIDSGTFWLSETPDEKSGIAWNASNVRICTYAVLKNKETDQIYAHFNTHFDHTSDAARDNAALILTSRINRLSEQYGDIAVIATGDFNSLESNNSYKVMTMGMDDSRKIAENVVLDCATFCEYQNPDNWESGYNGDVNSTPNVDYKEGPIDFIFLKKGTFDVKTYTVINDTFTFDCNGTTYHDHPVSDHYGVYCEAKISDTIHSYYDDSKTVDITANKYLGDADSLSDATLNVLNSLGNIAENATVTSNLQCAADFPALGIISGTGTGIDSSKYTGRVFWELTTALDKIYNVSGISFETGDNKSAISDYISVYGSSNGTSWIKLGGSIIDGVSENSNAYFILNDTAEINQIKLVMPDAPTNAFIKGVKVYGVNSDSLKKIKNSTEVTPISGPQSGTKEGFEKAFDDSTDTKLYTKPSISSEPVVWKTTNRRVTAAAYSFTTASDTASYPNRNPVDWVLYGSNNGESWSEVDAVTGAAIPTANTTETVFTIDNPTAYQYYKLEIDFSKIPVEGTESRVQLSEISLYEQSSDKVPTRDEMLTIKGICDYASECSVDYKCADISGLPESVNVVLACGVEKSLYANWVTTEFDPGKVGYQTVNGKLTLDDGLSDPDKATENLSLKVAVLPMSGDIDFDGNITVSDVVTLRKAIMSADADFFQIFACDFDESKNLTVSDVVALRSYIMMGK